MATGLGIREKMVGKCLQLAAKIRKSGSLAQAMPPKKKPAAAAPAARGGYKQGEVADQEIKTEQRSCKHAIPGKHFRNLVRAILACLCEEMGLEWQDRNIKMKGMALLQTAAEAAMIEIITAAEKLANHRGASSVCRVGLVQLRHLADGISASALQLLQCGADRRRVIDVYKAKFAVMDRAPSSRRQRVLKQRKFLTGLEKLPRTPRIAKNPAPKSRGAKKR